MSYHTNQGHHTNKNQNGSTATWSQVQQIQSNSNQYIIAQEINAIFDNESNQKYLLQDLLTEQYNFNEKTYLDLKEIMKLNTSKNLEKFQISLIPCLFYLYIYYNQNPYDQSQLLGIPLVEVLLIELHVKFIKSQNFEQENLEEFMSKLSETDKLIFHKPIKLKERRLADYDTLKNQPEIVFSDLFDIYNKNSQNIVSSSRIYLLSACVFICGFDCKPNDLACEDFTVVRQNQSFPGIKLHENQLKEMLICVKTIDDIGVLRNDLIFTFKALRSKVYNECLFDLAMQADAIDINLTGLSEFNFL